MLGHDIATLRDWPPWRPRLRHRPYASPDREIRATKELAPGTCLPRRAGRPENGRCATDSPSRHTRPAQLPNGAARGIDRPDSGARFRAYARPSADHWHRIGSRPEHRNAEPGSRRHDAIGRHDLTSIGPKLRAAGTRYR